MSFFLFCIIMLPVVLTGASFAMSSAMLLPAFRKPRIVLFQVCAFLVLSAWMIYEILAWTPLELVLSDTIAGLRNMDVATGFTFLSLVLGWCFGLVYVHLCRRSPYFQKASPQ